MCVLWGGSLSFAVNGENVGGALYLHFSFAEFFKEVKVGVVFYQHLLSIENRRIALSLFCMIFVMIKDKSE